MGLPRFKGLPRFRRKGFSETGDVEMVPLAFGVGRKGSERGDVERVPRG